MSNYRNLNVWHRTLNFVSRVYDITAHFPAHELYGLTNQIRRAATSIALNIAEGATSGYDTEFSRFLRLAIRSTNEVSAGFEIARRLNYCDSETAMNEIQEADQIASMLQGLARSLKSVSEPKEGYNTFAVTLDDPGSELFDNQTQD
jgi:four helix bundle protein